MTITSAKKISKDSSCYAVLLKSLKLLLEFLRENHYNSIVVFSFGIHGDINYNTFLLRGYNALLMISPPKKRKYVDALKSLPLSGEFNCILPA